jgi:acetyltransferase
MSAENNAGEFDKYKKNIFIRDGSTVFLRPMQGNDVDRVLELFHRFSQETIYLRFHHVVTKMSREEAVKYCTIDYDNTFALVATIEKGASEKLLAIGRYYRLPRKDAAEFAIVVADKYQKQGIGTHLMKELSAVAKAKGVRFFEGEVLIESKDMMQIIKDSGFQETQEFDEGAYHVVLDLDTYQ